MPGQRAAGVSERLGSAQLARLQPCAGTSARCRERPVPRSLSRSQPGRSRPGPRPTSGSPKQPRQAARGARRGPGRGAAAPAHPLTRSTYPMSCCRRARVSWRERCAGLMAALLASLPGRCRCCCPRRAAPAGRSPAPAAPPAGRGAGSAVLGCLVDAWWIRRQRAAPCHIVLQQGIGWEQRCCHGTVTEPAAGERSPWPPAHS